MTIKMPKTTVSIIPSYVKIENAAQKVLFIGQMLSGTATASTLYTSVGNDNEQNTLFGTKSMLAGMIRAFKVVNKINRVDAIALADVGAGVQAYGTIAFTGPSTEAGTLEIIVGSGKNHVYTLAITSAMSATLIGDALVAAITADANAPFAAVNTTGSVRITASHKGTDYNNMGLYASGSVAGVAVAITAMAHGATDPTLATLSTLVKDIRYQTIVAPYYLLSTIQTFLDARFNVDNNVLDGVAILSTPNVYATSISTLNALDTQSLVIIPTSTLAVATRAEGGNLKELDYVIASEVAAIRALRLTPGTDISRFVIAANGSRDNFGGPAIASLPYFNTTVYDLPLIESGDEYTDAEIAALTTAGGTVLSNNPANTYVIMGQAVTTYKTDSAGNPDVTFKYLEYVDTASQVREYFYNNLKARYAQCRLTDGDVIPGRNMANSQSIAAFVDGLYNDLSGVDYVLTQAGETAKSYFKANRTVTIDMSTGKVTIVMIVPIVTQLREINATMQISFDITG